jgi:hypothetical protein
MPEPTTVGLTDTDAEATGLALSAGAALQPTINIEAVSAKDTEYLSISVNDTISSA